ncbi:MAG: DNA polymerase/3'-5' exonuclease PolX [Planctomycetota bacterium]|nr:DNA polymerase/3'-5' exonuclease PolX [Planctomycetota bacterium]
MKNKELAAIFKNIADLLEIKDEKSFRVLSYRRTARTIKDLPKDVEALAAEGGLIKLPGVGKGTVEKIEQYLSNGKIDLREELLASVPAGLPLLLDIPGMGPKKVALVWQELGVESLDDLKKVIASGEAAKLKGLGPKSVGQIQSGIEFAEKASGRTPMGLAWPVANHLADQVRAIKGVKRVAIAGSLRRGAETIGDLDLLCEAKNGASVVAAFTSLPQVQRVLASGSTKGAVLVTRQDGIEIQADLRVVPTESFGAALQYFTGSKEHNVHLRELASKKKWKLNEWGLHDGKKRIAGKTEESIYKKLGLPLIPPEMREDRGEFEPDAVEKLIERQDIRGDLHMHTTASDGTMDAITMARAAAAQGYEYIAITDHSKSSTIANGLSIDRMWRQIEKIRTLNKEAESITILVGCECDILSDGSLDYPDQILAACDVVVASVHSGMRQERKKITGRLLGAMENPYVTIMGHPTARLLNRREPMDLDMEAVVAKAAETNTALELNSSWQRLDLHDRHLRMARDAGVKIAIDTDAHAALQLEQMQYGIATARRGWLRAKDVINTMHLPSLRKWIRKKRRH